MEQRKRKSSATVASIETEYVRSLRKKEIWRNKQKKRLRTKTVHLCSDCCCIIRRVDEYVYSTTADLKEKEQQKMEMLAKLEEVKEEQELLKKQLVKLDDDDYIAKLARKEYFYLIKMKLFSRFPKTRRKQTKKDDGKE